MYGRSARFAVISLFKKYSCLMEGAELALSRCPGGENRPWDKGTPEEVKTSISPGRKRLLSGCISCAPRSADAPRVCDGTARPAKGLPEE